MRLNLFKQIHDIAFNSQGSYTWDVVYSMPIFLRKFALNEINKYIKQQNSQFQKNNSSTLMDSEGKIKSPKFIQKNFDYTTKSSPKK